MTDWEKIKTQFEQRAVCRHGNKPKIEHDGCTWIECGDKCKCTITDGDGIPLSQFLAKWVERFSA